MKSKKKVGLPSHFGYRTIPRKFSYHLVTKTITETEIAKLNQQFEWDAIATILPHQHNQNTLWIDINIHKKILSYVSEKIEDDFSKSYVPLQHIVIPNIRATRPARWVVDEYNPNLEFLDCLQKLLNEGMVLEKIIEKQMLFRKLRKNEKIEYLLIDRAEERYAALDRKNYVPLQNVIMATAKKGFRFVGGFLGALFELSNAIDYSAWVFVSDPRAETALHQVIPVVENFADRNNFIADTRCTEVMDSWAKEGWELSSVCFSSYKKEKTFSYYPVTFFTPFLVFFQVNPDYKPPKEEVNQGKPTGRMRTNANPVSNEGKSEARTKSSKGNEFNHNPKMPTFRSSPDIYEMPKKLKSTSNKEKKSPEGEKKVTKVEGEISKMPTFRSSPDIYEMPKKW